MDSTSFYSFTTSIFINKLCYFIISAYYKESDFELHTPGIIMDQCGEASAVTKLSALTLQDRTLLTAKVNKINHFIFCNNKLENQ